jgi:hypothetical protein
MKADPNISWSEKGELKYKGETVRGSNVVDLVNDVLRKRKYFNPQGWEMLGSAFIFRTNSSALVFIVFGAHSTIVSSIASFVSVSITAGGDVDTLDTTGLGL